MLDLNQLLNIYLKLNLGDFKILVAGGSNALGYTNNVEIIDIETTRSNCPNFPVLPVYGYGKIGLFGYNNNPMVCGGYYVGNYYKYVCFILK